MHDDQHGREIDFHDHWAHTTAVTSIDADAAFTAPTALENQYILQHLGSLAGKRLLDIGCGLGESSVMFAKLGACVTASDLSPEMIRMTGELARQHGVTLQTHIGAAETLALPAGAFDIIYAANVIHHLPDRLAFLRNVERLLANDGVFCSWDPVKYNPVINIYRRMAAAVRSADERPLGRAELAEIRTVFPAVEVRFFWLLSLLLFVKYFLFDRLHPSRERYWKRIYQENRRTLWWWYPLKRLDDLLLRLPGIRWLSWNIVIVARKSERRG